MNVKIRNKFIEIKYSVSNGLVIFITVRNHNRSTTLGGGGGLNQFYGYPTSPSASVCDPFIYALRLSNVQQGYKNIIMKTCKTRRSNSVQITTLSKDKNLF